MALQKQVVRVPFAGLDTKSDPKAATIGRLDLVENAIARRRTEGGIEFEKAPGFTSLVRTTTVGASITAGRQAGGLGSELVMTDATKLYTYDSAQAKWIPRGHISQVSAVAERVSYADSEAADAMLCDVAYAGGYACFVLHRVILGGGSSIRTDWYVKELATGAIAGSGIIAATASNARVVAVGSAFFIFYDNDAGTLSVRKISTSAPNTIGSASNISTALTGAWDVIADVTNSRIVVGLRVSGGLQLQIWNTDMTAGTTATYGAVDPTRMGFVQHTFANANGYVVVSNPGDSNKTRVLTFGASSMTVTVNTVVDISRTANVMTGYFSTVINVIYAVTIGPNTTMYGWSNGTGYTVNRSLSLASKAFEMGGKRYVLGAYDDTLSPTATVPQVQNCLFLVEMDQDATGVAGDRRIAGYLLDQASPPKSLQIVALGAVAVVDASTALVAWASFEIRDPATLSKAFTLQQITLDFSGAKLGAPVQFAGALHVPSAAPKIYDGHSVTENGFYLFPSLPTLTGVNGGSLTALGTFAVCCVYECIDRAGRRHQSAASAVKSLTLTGSQQTITVQVSSLRVTDRDATHNLNAQVPQVSVVFYCTQAGRSNFHRITTIANDPTADTVSVNISASDATIAKGEPLYTSEGAKRNRMPPAVLAYEVHRDRMFALASDVLWISKDLSGIGEAVAFSDGDGFFVDFDAADGILVGVASMGTVALAISKRNKVYLLSGEGPDLSGNNTYAFPQAVEAEEGFISARAWCRTPEGILFKSSKGFRMLTRAGDIAPVEGAELYDSLTVTGGVTLDGLPHAALVTSDGRILKYDWQLKQWYTRTGHAFVACTRHQNQLIGVMTDGTVRKEVAASYADDGAAYAMAVETTFVNLEHARTYKALVHGEAAASCTLTGTMTVDWDASTAQAKAIALTTAAADRGPWLFVPSAGRCKAVQLKLSESSTGAGVKLSLIGLEVGIKPGAAKYAAGKYMT